MFPRGYFGRVGRFVAWILLVAAGAWGFLQLVHAFFRAEVKVDKVSNLHLCDCSNQGKNANLSYHDCTCSYYIWAMRQTIKNKQQMGKEDKNNAVQT